MVGQMGGELGHTPRVAGGADAPTLAGEGDQALMAAVLAAGSGEPVGQDAAAQVGSEVLLDPPRHAVAQRVGFCSVGEEGLDMVLDDRVERCGGRTSWSVGGRRRRMRGPGR